MVSATGIIISVELINISLMIGSGWVYEDLTSGFYIIKFLSLFTMACMFGEWLVLCLIFIIIV